MAAYNTYVGKQEFTKMFFRFATVPDLYKCLKQIKLLTSLHACAPISKLPSKISTMIWYLKSLIFFYMTLTKICIEEAKLYIFILFFLDVFYVFRNSGLIFKFKLNQLWMD